MAVGLAIEAEDLDHGAVEDQPHNVEIAGKITLLPGLPGRAGLLARPG